MNEEERAKYGPSILDKFRREWYRMSEEKSEPKYGFGDMKTIGPKKRERVEHDEKTQVFEKFLDSVSCCGDTGAVLDLYADFLEAHNAGPYGTSLAGNFSKLAAKYGEPVTWTVLNLLSNIGMTEHGTSCSGGWLTEAGVIVKDMLRDERMRKVEFVGGKEHSDFNAKLFPMAGKLWRAIREADDAEMAITATREWLEEVDSIFVATFPEKDRNFTGEQHVRISKAIEALYKKDATS